MSALTLYSRPHVSQYTRPIFWSTIAALGLLTLLPTAQAILNTRYDLALIFFISGLFYAFLAIICFFVRPLKSFSSWFQLSNTTKYSEFLFIIAFFMSLPVLAAIPTHLIIPEIGVVGAYFEMTSALTTTGASLLSSTSVYPESIILWRSLIAGYGGLTMIVLASAILAPRGFDGRNILPHGRYADIIQLDTLEYRLFLACKRYFKLYFGGILVGCLGFQFAGNTLYHSLLLAITGLATCGFKIPLSEGSAFNMNRGSEFVLLLLMLYGAFLPIIMLYTTRYRTSISLKILRDPEVNLGLGLIIIVSCLVFLRHWFGAFEFDVDSNITAFLDSVWGTIFTVTSFATTTGVESIYWPQAQLWSGIANPAMLLLFLAAIGGASSSSTGGIKLMRILNLSRQSLSELLKLTLPNQIVKEKASRFTPDSIHTTLQITWVFFMLFIIVFAMGLCILTLMGLSFETSIIVALSSLTNTGPAYNLFAQDALEYRAFRSTTQLFLCVLMLLGRIETLVLIAFLNPYYWFKFK